MVPGHQSLRTDKQFVKSVGSTRKLLVLIILAHKSFHDADGRHILLNTLVQLVVLLIHLREES